MKKIIVTGGCGFIGSHLVEHLTAKGYSVTAFDRYNSNNNWGFLEKSKFKNDFRVILGDVRDFDSVKKAIKGNNIVIHLAALIGIPYSYLSPLAYIKTNVEGTYNVLEVSKELKIEKTIVTSTSEVYGSALYLPIDEKHPLQPQSPYSASKIGADNLSMSYFNSFNLPITIIRPFNTYGPRQSARAVIPTISSQLISSKKVSLGNIDTMRDFTYVDDLCNAYEIVMKSKSFNGNIINVGSNEFISIGDLYNKIEKLLKIKKSLLIDNKRKRTKKSEVSKLLCDNSKIIQNTKWKPKITLENGLKKTLTWIKRNKGIFKDHLYNV